MSSLEVKVQPLSLKCRVPTSKSYANRLLILGALSQQEFTLIDLPPSTDVQTMIACLKKIGLKITEKDHSICIHNSFPECESDRVSEDVLSLETGDGGTTNRFLLALLALGKKEYCMKLKGDMRSRPMKEMESILSECHCSIHNNHGDITVQGPLHYQGTIEVDCSKSTQFLTAFKMIEHKCKGITFEAKALHSSKAYYEMTLQLIKESRSQNTFTIPPDYSSLGYLLAAGLTLGDVHVENCFGKDPFQADSIFLDLIEKMEGDLKITSEGLFLNPSHKLKPITIDCANFPDLVPTLAYLCSYTEGTSRLKNLEVLTYKESDRFLEIKKLLTLFEVSFEEEGYDLIIHGSLKKCSSKVYRPAPDHRMVMVGYLFMRRNNGGQLFSTEHVNKSYGSFFSQFQ